jgi:hypothetical protein
MTTPKSRAERLADDQAVIDGLNQFFAKNAKLTFGSESMLPAAISAVFQARIVSAKAALRAKAAATAAVAADRSERAQTAKFALTFRRFVQVTFANSPDTLAAFNLTAPKAGKATVATKAEAQVKGKATREARGTKGPKAKLEITGATASEAPAGSTAPQAPAAKPTA